MQYNTVSSMLFFMLFFKTFSCAAIEEYDLIDQETSLVTSVDELATMSEGDIGLGDSEFAKQNIESSDDWLELADLFEGDISLGEEGLVSLYNVHRNKQWPGGKLVFDWSRARFNQKQKKIIYEGGLQNKNKSISAHSIRGSFQKVNAMEFSVCC